VRLLVLDHYFQQDIESLREELGDDGELRVVPYDLFRREALDVFPPEVATGLEPYARPEWEGYRRLYATRMKELFQELFIDREFDAFVSPSDAFFYVRTAPEAAHALGVPFFVAQKETTITDHTMRVHAERVAAYAPPVADHMTVCSERHKEFWVRAGGDPGRITVTGQPRFDVYAKPAARRGGDEPVALFFSYAADSYHPSEGVGESVWSQLHRETEEGLGRLAGAGWKVLVKPHPQQDVSRLSLGPGVSLVDPQADARRLIADADVAIGFQTTALLECMLAGTPVVYTGWDAEAQRLSGELIPFHEWGDVIDVVTRAEELASTIEAARERDPAERAERRAEIATEFLGPVDGGASRRTLETIRATVEAFARERDPAVERLREELAARRPPLARRVRSGLSRLRSAVR
jgi:CDP-Glycerol:Poly(glycerophosphate) glycerophosphotransferase